MFNSLREGDKPDLGLIPFIALAFPPGWKMFQCKHLQVRKRSFLHRVTGRPRRHPALEQLHSCLHLRCPSEWDTRSGPVPSREKISKDISRGGYLESKCGEDSDLRSLKQTC